MRNGYQSTSTTQDIERLIRRPSKNEILLQNGNKLHSFDFFQDDESHDEIMNLPKAAFGAEVMHSPKSSPMPVKPKFRKNGKGRSSKVGWIKTALGQIPAVLLACLLNLMIGIPFGVSYFPIGWRATADVSPEEGNEDMVNGAFPMPGKDALGIRMFLFSTIISQFVFTYASYFDNVVGLQMVENVPFCHSLAYICINEQGYGKDALSTLFFLFAFASVLVGMVFFLLGWFNLGRVVYFFPSHVLIGCIGGIGAFIVQVAVEVTNDAPFSLQSIISKIHLFGVVLAFETILRIIIAFTRDKDGKQRYPLLAPIYYCAITPIFYLVLLICRIDLNKAQKAGFFFPPLESESSCDWAVEGDCSSKSVFSSIFNKHLLDIWGVIDFSTISWTAVGKSVPTLVSLVAFSLIHVPINIPAFAITINADVDMNNELKAHGYSNGLAGIFGGLQNYLCYADSVLYSKSGGKGKISSLVVALLTTVFFFVGPSIASFIPRCMAGTLLLHLGIDLVLEGVYDSYGNFDWLEYAGIWLITVVMNIFGMSAALVAGIVAALSTYAVQSGTHLNPVRGSMSATTLRSSRWNRSHEENTILEDKQIGRKRILVVQLHGHIFFGNVSQLTEKITSLLEERSDKGEDALIVIMDFTLVVGIDSTSAQAIAKLKNTMHNKFNLSIAIYVTGSCEGFPCEYGLSEELGSPSPNSTGIITRIPIETDDDSSVNETTRLLESQRQSNRSNDEPVARFRALRRSLSRTRSTIGVETSIDPVIPADHVCDSLDSALMFAEDALIAMQDSKLLNHDLGGDTKVMGCCATISGEKDVAIQYLSNLCPGEDTALLERLFSSLKREVYSRDQIVWMQGSTSDCAKLLVKGILLSYLEDEAGTTDQVPTGAVIGELGLVKDIDRLSTVKCVSEEAVLYSLDQAEWKKLVENDPKAARCIDIIAIGYLTHRVQYVSNRIFETRCLPV